MSLCFLHMFQLAVHHGYGGIHGREKALWMVDAVYNWFQENDGIEPDELEGFIAEVMDNEFDTRAEDGSLLLVGTSEIMFSVWRECLQILNSRKYSASLHDSFQWTNWFNWSIQNSYLYIPSIMSIKIVA